MFEITVTVEGRLFYFLNLSALVKADRVLKSSVNYVSVLSEGDRGKWTPFSMKLVSKSVVAVVW